MDLYMRCQSFNGQCTAIQASIIQWMKYQQIINQMEKCWFNIKLRSVS
ncbi:unnamed protein product [Paramecium primaurelia]|uniref:Uncharacterized protein n=1 Tax=Paramecium primaurelia TaxID=5886 RepID=A0A8S1QK55_PARPR|nr:unnamed protein product [Paramecium primaurelia]